MSHINPVIDWYISLSTERGVLPRCPFATADKCPRFYQSLALLGAHGSTQISEDVDERLLTKWRESDLWPIVLEQASAVSGGGGSAGYHHFCPEVTYDRFGFFATYLHEFVDEIDSDQAHKRLSDDGMSGDDWRWAWMGLTPMHYTECPIYSVLSHRSARTPEPSPVGDSQQTTRVGQYLLYLKNHRLAAILITIGLVVIGLGTLTDALDKIAKFYTRLTDSTPSATAPIERSAVTVILHEIRQQREGRLHVDPVFRFLIRNRGNANASLPSAAEITMLAPVQRSYTLLRQPYVEDQLPMPIEAGAGQQFVDYMEDDHHIAAQLREGKAVHVRMQIPHIDFDGTVQHTTFDTIVRPDDR